MRSLERPPGMTRRWTAGRIIGLVVKFALPLFVLGGAYWGYETLKAMKPALPDRPRVEQSWTVETQPVRLAQHRPEITAYGTVVPGRRVELRALVGGQVASVGEGLQEGASVAAGDLLLEIDRFDYEGLLIEAKANLAEARARLAESEARMALETAALESARAQALLAETDLERAEQLQAREAVAQKTIDDRRSVLIQRRQEISQRENNLAIEAARADQQRAQIERLAWRERQAARDLEQTTLRAPFDAYVGSVNAEIGRLLSGNDTVATLYDRRQFDVRFSLTDSQYGRLEEEGLIDRPVEVRWHVGDRPYVYMAQIERVAAEITAARGGVDVLARIDAAQAAVPLRPGAFVEVVVQDRAYPSVARVPATTIYGTDRLYVVEDGRLAGRGIEIVGHAGTDVFVRGEIADGDRIVVTRITEAGDGLKVIEQDAAADAPVTPQAQVPTGRGDG